MNLANLPTIITLLVALSVATERFVEIVKGMFWQLQDHKEDPRLEAQRRMRLHLLAVAGGIGVTALALPVVTEVMPSGRHWLTVVALGLLASGGSGFWNTILGYVLNIKDLRKADLQAVQRDAAQGRPLPQPAEGALVP